MNRTGLSPRLALRQSQSLVMTPRLQQAIKMLQLSNLELGEFVDAEIECNPLLDRREPGAAPTTEGAAGTDAIDNPALPAARAGEFAAEAGEIWHAAAGEEGDGSVDRGGEPQPGRQRDGAIGSDRSGFGPNAARPRSLRDHLLEQIGADLSDPAERVVALVLLDQLDETGYLTGGLDGTARLLGCAVAAVEAVLGRLQQFDPAGVFARDLRECLALQLRERDRLDPAMQVLLDHLPLVGARDLAALKRICGVDAEDVADMIAELRSLDPRPGLAFDPPLAPTIVPDILMRARHGGGWTIELNATTLPRVLIDRRYHLEISRGAHGKIERDYLNERLQAANWLIKSLHQRATTILKVAAEIVRRQDGFFRHGVQSLRPLALREVAAEIGMHESTVSRATSNKYIATPRGLFELKYFFTAALPAAGGGDAHSAEAVRHRIRRLIDGEPPADTLSDETIVALLRRDGVDVARRTVAKYREAMHIPSSVQRRREKRLPL